MEDRVKEYFTKILNIHCLLNEEEIENLIRKAKNKDVQAKEKIIKETLSLIAKIILRHFKHFSDLIDLRDLISVGVIGVNRAIEKFDFSRRIKFSTYAAVWIKGLILKSIENAFKNKKFIWDSIVLEETICDQNPTSEEIIEIKDTEAKIRKILSFLTPREEKILRMRFGIGEEKKSLQKTGNLFTITRERARQIEAKALKELRIKFIQGTVKKIKLDDYL